MFESKTVFVVGAGASREAGLPIGSELKLQIRDLLDIRYTLTSNPYSPNSADSEIAAALFQHVTSKGSRDINPYLMEAWRIRDSMPQALSIDNYIDAHQGNSALELCGKLAIAKSILQAEANSKLNVNEDRQETFEPSNLGDTWYDYFFKMLTENIRKRVVDRIFENVSFIIFNYDRCLEHFLWHSLQIYYGLQPADATALIEKLTIYHPYGTVGNLPWRNQNTGVAFGGRQRRGTNLLGISTQIKTFTERMEDEPVLANIKNLICEAETIIFLGFAFHPLNMELIAPTSEGSVSRVFATAFGISNADMPMISRDIINMARNDPQRGLSLRNDLTCAKLFLDYWHTLSRGK